MVVALIITLLHALCTFVYTWVQLALSASNVRARFHFGVSVAFVSTLILTQCKDGRINKFLLIKAAELGGLSGHHGSKDNLQRLIWF